MVASYVQLIKQRYEGKLDPDADDFIEYAVDGANRMKRLINDLLTFSRVGTRGRPFETTRVSDVLRHVQDNLAMAIEEAGADIVVDPLPTIEADEAQLVQLFQNLLANAIKFRREGEHPRIRVSAAREGDDWIFRVEDNGIGIEDEYFDKIFIIFQRLHGKGDFPGTGIGLSVCKKIVERHGGRIWVESKPCEGSVFQFSLPTRRVRETGEQ